VNAVIHVPAEQVGFWLTLFGGTAVVCGVVGYLRQSTLFLRVALYAAIPFVTLGLSSL
jgi:hypothetical protein